jgi:hypothetical protein
MTMAKLSELKGLNSKIEKGAWVKDLPNLQKLGVAVKVRGYGNSDHMKAMGDAYADMSAEDRENPDIRYQIDGRLIAQTLLLDWKGIEDFPFTPANVKTVMTDPELRIFRAGIDFATKVVAEQGVDKLEKDTKK